MNEDQRSAAERFWEKVDVRGPDDCWEWKASRSPQGYGFFWDGRLRKMARSHRVAYELAIGPLAEKAAGETGAVGELVCHHCDNPPCCNPAHLFLGSQKDNMRDRERKGRGPDQRGSANGRARLTAEQAAAARAEYTGAYGQLAALARKYGVSHGAMSHVIHGRSWTAAS